MGLHMHLAGPVTPLKGRVKTHGFYFKIAALSLWAPLTGWLIQHTKPKMRRDSGNFTKVYGWDLPSVQNPMVLLPLCFCITFSPTFIF